MTLAARLDAIRTAFAGKAPDEAKAVMTKSAEALRGSGILATVPSIGVTAPDFSLTDSQGNEVTLRGLLQSGPVILTFFRGHW